MEIHWKVYSHTLLVEMGKCYSLCQKQHLFKIKENIDCRLLMISSYQVFWLRRYLEIGLGGVGKVLKKKERKKEIIDNFWPSNSIPNNVPKRNKNFRLTYKYTQSIIVYCGSKLETVVMLTSHRKVMHSFHETLWKH